MVVVLEPRALMSAVNDTATLGANQSTVEFDIIDNDDIGQFNDWQATIGSGTHGSLYFTNPGSSTNNDVRYVFMDPVQSLGAYTAAVTSVTSAITEWAAIEYTNIGDGFDAANAALGRLGTFLNQWGSGGTSWLAAFAGGAGTVGGALGYAAVEVGGLVVGVLATAAQNNQGQAFAVILAAAEQDLIDRKVAANAAVTATVTQYNADFAALLAGLPNPEHITSDSINYDLEEIIHDGMDITYEQSTATVTVSMDVFNYSALVTAVEEFESYHGNGLAMHMPPLTDINAIYGESLKIVAAAQGWHDNSSLYFYESDNLWTGWATDWWWFDATDVRDELNAIEYFEHTGW